MKIETKKIDTTKREINIEVSGDIIKNKFDEVFNRIAKEAKVPGFRPGNAPRDILEKNFSSDAHQAVMKELIPDVYNEAIDKEGLDVIEMPEISDVKLDRNILSFKASVEIRPEIKLKDYKGIEVEYKKITVDSDELKRSLDSMKETRKLDNIDDSFAKSLGYPDLGELEKAIQRQIYLQKENIQRQKIENEIVKNIIKDIDFKLPQSLVKRQLQELVRQAKLDLALKGVDRQEIEKQEETITKNFEAEAKEQVKVYMILAEIAKKENMPLDEHMPRQVMEFLLREAEWKEIN